MCETADIHFVDFTFIDASFFPRFPSAPKYTMILYSFFKTKSTLMVFILYYQSLGKEAMKLNVFNAPLSDGLVYDA